MMSGQGVDKKDPPSISLSLPVINATKNVRVFMTGESKVETVTKGVMKLEAAAGGLDEHLDDM
jgi:6-phosphogluconolactonase/glucosamine-6-phosphate isomerase/deaminase